MYKISFLTLFPASFNWIKEYSIIKNAIKKQNVELEVINFRDWSNNKHKKVDDYQYGGGPGMVIRLQPILDCLKDIKTEKSKTFLLSPQGIIFKQNIARQLINTTNHLILICGHYEGIDSRIKYYIDGEISIGDFIVSGGEIPAMLMADSLIRLLDGTISQDSLESESFENNLLDYSVFTKPVNYEGYVVPEILLSGNHKLIDEYRLKERIELTKLKRPDLFEKYISEKKEKEDGNYKN